MALLSKVIGRPFDSLKPIYVCRTYQAAIALGTYLQSILKKRPRAENQLRHIWRINGMTVNVLQLFAQILISETLISSFCKGYTEDGNPV